MRFGSTRHYHVKFKDWVGSWVFVELDDCWAVNVNVWPDEPWKDPRTLLNCINEKDWLSADPEASSLESRRRPTRICN